MSGLVFNCEDCKKLSFLDLDIDFNACINAFGALHPNHKINVGLKTYIPEKYRDRPFTKHVRFVNNEDSLVGVEIGVDCGNNAMNLLFALKMKMLYLVDPYDSYDGYDKSDFKTKSPEEAFHKAKENLKDSKGKFMFIKKKSCDALDDIPDNLDFVYIDGNHSYEYVKRDLEMYYKKLRFGGVIGGHDFNLHSMDVIKAVIDFIDENHLEDFSNVRDDFWITKHKDI